MLSGLVHGHTLAGAMAGVDPNVSHKAGDRATYHLVRTAPMHDATAVDGSCDVTLQVITARGELRRLVVDGQEQVLDRGWSLDYEVPAGESRTWELAIVHPVTKKLEPRRRWFTCRKQHGPRNYWEVERWAR